MRLLYSTITSKILGRSSHISAILLSCDIALVSGMVEGNATWSLIVSLDRLKDTLPEKLDALLRLVCAFNDRDNGFITPPLSIHSRSLILYLGVSPLG